METQLKKEELREKFEELYKKDELQKARVNLTSWLKTRQEKVLRVG